MLKSIPNPFPKKLLDVGNLLMKIGIPPFFFGGVFLFFAYSFLSGDDLSVLTDAYTLETFLSVIKVYEVFSLVGSVFMSIGVAIFGIGLICAAYYMHRISKTMGSAPCESAVSE